MITRLFANIALFATLAILLPIQVAAFGLGKLELSSALNQPFKAEIPVTAMREGEYDDLQVRLATNDEFKRAGIERSHYLTQLEFNVLKEVAGTAKIVITSQQPIKEPFIDFLLTATTGAGRLIRQYTVLLDFPQPVLLKPAQQATTIKQQKKQPIANKQRSVKTTSYQYPDFQLEQPSNDYAGDSYGPIKRDDTLWSIAKRTKPSEQVTTQQMMLALFDTNPNAFLANNINNLKADETLTIPSIEDITKISQNRAMARLNKQYKQQENGKAIDATIKAGQQNQDTDHKDNTENNNGGRLQLLAVNDETAIDIDKAESTKGSDQISQLTQQLSLARATIADQKQETTDLKSRITVMEKQLADMRGIISVKDAELAQLQAKQQAELATEELIVKSDNEFANINSRNDLTDNQAMSVELAAAVNEAKSPPATAKNDDASVDNEEIMLAEEVDSADIVNDNDLATLNESGQDNDVAILPTQASVESTGAVLAEQTVNPVDNADTGSDNDLATLNESGQDNDVAILPTQASVESTGAVLAEQTVNPVDNADTGSDNDLATLNESGQDNDVAILPTQTPVKSTVLALAEQTADEASTNSKALNEYDSGGVNMENQNDSLMVNDGISSQVNNSAAKLDVSVTSFIEQLTEYVPNYQQIDSFITQYRIYILAALIILLLVLIVWRVVRHRRQHYEWPDTVSIQGVDIGQVATDHPDDGLEQDKPIVSSEQGKSIADLINQAEIATISANYQQADDLLEQATSLEPDNQMITLQRIALAYYQKQADKFNSLIKEVNLAEESPEWQKIIKWGNELSLENQLFIDNSDNSNESDEQQVNRDTDSKASTILEATVAETENNDDSGVELANNEADFPTFPTLDTSLESTDDSEAKQDNIEVSSAGSTALETTVAGTEHTDQSSIELTNSEADAQGLTALDPTIAEPENNDESGAISLEAFLAQHNELELLSPVESDVNLDVANSEIVSNDDDSETVTELTLMSTEDQVTDDVASETVAEHEVTLPTERQEDQEQADLTTAAKPDIASLTAGTREDDLEFDIGNIDEVDEAETKLELAVTYIDMGDVNGAKHILNEVVSEGNEQQQSRAQQLLNSL